MIGSHHSTPDAPPDDSAPIPEDANGSAHPPKDGHPDHLTRFVIDQLRRAFAAGAIVDRDHHHPDTAHALYQDGADGANGTNGNGAATDGTGAAAAKTGKLHH